MANLLKNFEESAIKQIEKNLRNLRLADLEIFISAARLGSLGQSAIMHHLSQSAASSAIFRVEEVFSVQLCTHEKRRFRLTHEGKVLLPKLEKIMNQFKALIYCEEELPLRLVTTHAIAQVITPELLSFGEIEFRHMRPDMAYSALIQGEADIALVLDNAPWKGVMAAEVGRGHYQLYCRDKNCSKKPILLPEDQFEVLALKQVWKQINGYSLPVKSRIPSWSLIAQICDGSDEVGFLPEFLARKYALEPVLWQPNPSHYRLLALYRSGEPLKEKKILPILAELRRIFAPSRENS